MILQLAWSILALYGLTRAILLLMQARGDQKALPTTAPMGMRVLADWQVEHSWMGAVIYLFLLLAGVASLLYHAQVISQATTAVILPGSLVLALVVLIVRQDRNAVYRRRNLSSNKASRRGE